MKKIILKLIFTLGVIVLLLAIYYAYKDVCVELCRGQIYVPAEGFVGGGCYKQCSLFNLQGSRLIMFLMGFILSAYSLKKIKSGKKKK